MALIVDRSKAGLPAGYWLWQEKGGRAAAATGARGRPAARPGARGAPYSRSRDSR
jgi:hypothetical protein